MNPDQEIQDAENIIFVGANIMTGKSSIRYATKSKKVQLLVTKPGVQLGGAPPPPFHTLTKDMSFNTHILHLD